MNKKLLFIITSVLFSLPIFSAVNITGSVIDSQSNQLIEFVAVAIHDLATDKPVGGSLIDKDRVFNIGGVKTRVMN